MMRFANAWRSVGLGEAETGRDWAYLVELLVPLAAFPLWWVLYFC